jgi:hypothetical protein
MNSIKGFSQRRFFLLIRNILFLNRSFFLISAVTIMGVLLLLSSIGIIGQNNNPVFYSSIYIPVLFICGFSITEKHFKDFHNEVRGMAWMTLPASQLEKFSSHVFFLLIVFAAGIMSLFFFTSLISEGINQMLLGSSHKIFNPFTEKVLSATYTYFILQSLFMLGAIYFKKSPIIKTILSLILYVFVFVIIVGVSMKIIFGGSAWNFIFAGNPVTNVAELAYENDTLVKIWSVIGSATHIAFRYLLAPLCWVIGYIRLREKEI